MDEMKMGDTKQGGVCSCGHHTMMPILMILFGLTFLLGAFGTLDTTTVSYIWPVLVIIAGGMKWGEGKCQCC